MHFRYMMFNAMMKRINRLMVLIDDIPFYIRYPFYKILILYADYPGYIDTVGAFHKNMSFLSHEWMDVHHLVPHAMKRCPACRKRREERSDSVEVEKSLMSLKYGTILCPYSQRNITIRRREEELILNPPN